MLRPIFLEFGLKTPSFVNATNPQLTISVDGTSSTFPTIFLCSFCRDQKETLEQAERCCSHSKARQLRYAKELTSKYNRYLRETEKIAEVLSRLPAVEIIYDE